MTDLFVGIDLAIAKRKRLPVAVCEASNGRVRFLPLRDRNKFEATPTGMGNVCALDVSQRAAFVNDTVQWLHELERSHGKICRIAIDAPAAPCREGLDCRLAEEGLRNAHISYIKTLTISGFDAAVLKAQKHLDQGGAESRLPYANHIWMLVGFDLFAAIGATWECIEVFPQAIAHCLGAAGQHKSKREGLRAQLRAFANAIGFSGDEMTVSLITACYGADHDRLDAMMSAWVASLPDGDRIAYGNGDDDAIWIPLISSASGGVADIT